MYSLERGRRNAVFVTSPMKEPSDVSEKENEKTEPKEKDDVESEKNNGEKTGGVIDKENRANEEKEKDSDETPEPLSKVLNVFMGNMEQQPQLCS